MNYFEYNDNELLYYISENNEDATEIIYKKYEPLIKSLAGDLYRKCPNIGLEINDLIQEGMIGLDNAIETFDETRNNSFFTYAKKCINRKIIGILSKSCTKKNSILNYAVSYDDEKDLCKNVPELSNSFYRPDIMIASSELKENICDQIQKSLSPFEKQILVLRIEGFKYREIARKLKKEQKAIDNALQRIKIKIKNGLREIK